MNVTNRFVGIVFERIHLSAKPNFDTEVVVHYLPHGNIFIGIV